MREAGCLYLLLAHESQAPGVCFFFVIEVLWKSLGTSQKEILLSQFCSNLAFGNTFLNFRISESKNFMYIRILRKYLVQFLTTQVQLRSKGYELIYPGLY